MKFGVISLISLQHGLVGRSNGRSHGASFATVSATRPSTQRSHHTVLLAVGCSPVSNGPESRHLPPLPLPPPILSPPTRRVSRGRGEVNKGQFRGGWGVDGTTIVHKHWCAHNLCPRYLCVRIQFSIVFSCSSLRQFFYRSQPGNIACCIIVGMLHTLQSFGCTTRE